MEAVAVCPSPGGSLLHHHHHHHHHHLSKMKKPYVCCYNNPRPRRRRRRNIYSSLSIIEKQKNKNKLVYTRMNSCLVIAPPVGIKPIAVLKFLGGAFIGAVPEASYRYLLDLLSNEGFFIICVPYNVTFDHSQAATYVHQTFISCFHSLLTSPLFPHIPLANLPLYSVAHSNGALLQVLAGSYFSEKIPKANAIISYNNRPAAEAVPYFEQVGPLINQMMPVLEASPLYSLSRNASGDAWKAIVDMAGAMVAEYDQEALQSLTKFIDQLPSVLTQVTEGISEFKPTPSENLDCFKKSYNVPHTLLVKFSSDAIDETDTLQHTLRSRVEDIGGTLEKISLTGTHLTPCIQEPTWEVGQVYTPVDAIAQGLKSMSVNDTRSLSKAIANWFRSIPH